LRFCRNYEPCGALPKFPHNIVVRMGEPAARPYRQSNILVSQVVTCERLWEAFA